MRHKWELHGRNNEIEELYIKFGDDWRIVGWVQPTEHPEPYYLAYCHWINDGDYPENKVFATAKQARRALKAAATIAVVGGWTPNRVYGE